jgi:lysophospholipase L1-like esterase
MTSRTNPSIVCGAAFAWRQVLAGVLLAAAIVSASAAAPAVEPVEAVERTDPNSQLAHEQMVAKARAGGIDVYFLGDSITRRWGTSDAQYAELLANWRENFFGWNAGNFGWGGDSTQNVLWRMRNGELEGVNPKVIVLLAGTNDLPGLLRAGATPEVAAETVAGRIKAILDECQKLAPDATIILTAVFPRNDLPGVMPLVDAVNGSLEAMTDGDRLRFLNVNDRLADAEGNLLPGVMHDKLHPTVAGYQVWADGLKPMLTELLGPPAEEDHAPPPTGDSSAATPATSR